MQKIKEQVKELFSESSSFIEVPGGFKITGISSIIDFEIKEFMKLADEANLTFHIKRSGKGLTIIAWNH